MLHISQCNFLQIVLNLGHGGGPESVLLYLTVELLLHLCRQPTAELLCVLVRYEEITYDAHLVASLSLVG